MYVNQAARMNLCAATHCVINHQLNCRQHKLSFANDMTTRWTTHHEVTQLVYTDHPQCHPMHLNSIHKSIKSYSWIYILANSDFQIYLHYLSFLIQIKQKLNSLCRCRCLDRDVFAKLYSIMTLSDINIVLLV